MYEHLVAIVEIREKGYTYHYVSKDAQKVNKQFYLLTQKLNDNMLESLYEASVMETNDQSLDSVLSSVGKMHTIQLVKDLQAFVKLVYDKKLITIAKRLPEREMNNTEQLLDWFNGD